MSKILSIDENKTWKLDSYPSNMAGIEVVTDEEIWFAQSRNWTHGVGYGYALDDGLVFCNFAPFIKNKTVIDGRLVTL